MHKKVFNTLFIIQVVCFGYLCWWYYFSPYYGYYEPKVNILISFFASVFLMVGFLVIFVRSWFVKNKMLLLLIIPVLWLAILFEPFKSPVVFYYNEVDMSVYQRLRLYENGTYDHLFQAQTYAEYKEGNYICRNDSVILSGTGKWNADSMRNILTTGNAISVSGCGSLLQKHIVEKEDKQYSRALLWKWLWLR